MLDIAQAFPTTYKLKVQGFGFGLKVLLYDKIRVISSVLASMMLQILLYHLIGYIACTPYAITCSPITSR